jgi:DNA helicase-2/ATP-dependent DNA helicase PcrA
MAALRERLEGSSLDPGLFRIQTLNALGYEILRNNFPRDYNPIISEQRRVRLFRELKEACKEMSVERFCALPAQLPDPFYLGIFSLLKNELHDPRTLDPQRFADFILAHQLAKPLFDAGTGPADVRKIIEAVGWMFKAYERALRRDRLMDFDDQKLRPYLGLCEDAEARGDWQQKYSEIIVDEFQDINHLDFALIKLLAEKSNLVITGDDDQAIYGFRNCSSNFMIDLEKRLDRKVTSYELKINYRNPSNLVEHAARLIGHNTRRIRKDPISDLQGRAEIEVMAAPSTGPQAKLVVAMIKKIKRADPEIRYQDFAVLYRINSQSLPFQLEFSLNDIPYEVSESDHILRNEPLEKILGFFRLRRSLLSGKRPAAQDAILTLKAFFGGSAALPFERLRPLFQSKRNFYEILASQELAAIAPKIAVGRLAESLREAVAAPSLTKTLIVLAKRFQGLKEGNHGESAEGSSPLAEIFDFAASYTTKSPTATLDGASASAEEVQADDTDRFVEAIETAMDRARKNLVESDRDRGVALMTYFKSKGLQWRSVILTSCNEGIIPHKRAATEDERRLFYVAMTRASSRLLVSYVKRTWSASVAPSRFLSEAGLLRK